MKAVVEIDMKTTQAKHFVKFARTLPFATVMEDKPTKKSVWETAIAEGAIMPEEFFDELNARIEKWHDNA